MFILLSQLLFLFATVSAQTLLPRDGYFSSPCPSSVNVIGDFSNTKLWSIGDTIPLQWTVAFSSYYINLQQQHNKDNAGGVEVIYSRTADKPEVGQYNWTVAVDPARFVDNLPVFFFWIIPTGDGNQADYISSCYFNITENAVSSSTLPASSSTLSSSISSSMTSSPTASEQITSTTTSSTASSTTPAGASNNVNAQRGGNDNSGMKIGLGVGLGVGIPIMLLLAACVFLLLRHFRSAPKAGQPDPHAFEKQDPYRTSVKPRAELTPECRPSELSAEAQQHELPGAGGTRNWA